MDEITTLGDADVLVEPLWRVQVRLTDVERELLATWPVRRLGFIAHAGASSIATVQSYTRLEHSLGLLALVAHVAPGDRTARVAALLHDVGHLPFSHTLEGIAGLDHHDLGARRIRSLSPLLARHGLDAETVIDVVDGRLPSPLHGRAPGCGSTTSNRSCAAGGHTAARRSRLRPRSPGSVCGTGRSTPTPTRPRP